MEYRLFHTNPPLLTAVHEGDVEVSVPGIRALSHMHTHSNKVAHIYSSHYTFMHAHTPQQVKKLLASGIKPDAERNSVSVFWCRLD